jgi:hypothetical protein
LGSKRVGRTVLGALLCVVLLTAGMAGSARADDDEEDVPFDTKILRQILVSLGMRSSGGDIEYRERSPLVVPPNRNLPKPASKSATEKVAAWPIDQDVKRRREATAARKQSRTVDWEADARPLSPATMRGTGKGGQESSDNSRQTEPQGPMKPSELGYKGGLFSSLFNSEPKEEYKTFTGEVPRTSLIEPPSGYRTPSPYQPYGVGREKWTPPVIDRNELPR